MVVLACEIGGRWSQEAADFLRQLAEARSRSAPAVLRMSAMLGWYNRWASILAVASQAALAATLLGGDTWAAGGRDGATPALETVLEGGTPEFSRLPCHD